MVMHLARTIEMATAWASIMALLRSFAYRGKIDDPWYFKVRREEQERRRLARQYEERQ
jgi:hypothetical protein